MKAPILRAGSTLLDDLVVANRILAHYAVLDGFGHVSARHPDDPNCYLLSRSLAPELVTADDIMVYDLDSTAQHGDDRRPYLERFIHGEVYRLRPDVQAILHSHSPSVIPFAASSVPMRPIFHMSGYLPPAAKVFDIRHEFGATDMLIRSREQGRALAVDLGSAAVVLMRGHGFVAVAESVPLVVYRGIYTETNAALQQRAIALGGTVQYLDPEEATRADVTLKGVIERPWELWKAKVLGRS